MQETTSKPKVALALIEKDGRFLLIKRKVPQRGLVWAFPGGVTKPGETEEQAIVREAKEEVELDIKVGNRLLERKHPDTLVQIVYFDCKSIDATQDAKIGEPYEIAEIEWVPAHTVLERFTSDVHPVIQEFIRSYNTKESR